MGPIYSAEISFTTGVKWGPKRIQNERYVVIWIRIEKLWILYHGVSVSTDDFPYDNSLKSCHPTRGQLVDVVSQAQLAIPVVAPTIHIAIF